MYKDDLVLALRELKINFDYNNLIQINNYENKVTCPYIPSFSVSIKDYYEDIFLEMILLNIYICVKSIDYKNKIILFENNDSYKLIIDTEDPFFYELKLININDNLIFYENSTIHDDKLLKRELYKIISFLKFLGSVKI